MLKILFLAVPLILAATLPSDPSSIKRESTAAWHHPRDHFTHALFRRGPEDNFPAVGSAAWSQGFPQGTPDVSQLPSAWVNTLNAAVAEGKIPNIPPTTGSPGTNPVYPSGVNPTDPSVCSATYKCRSQGDIWDAPPGYFLLSVDDGPLPPTAALRTFLSNNNEHTTHFMIGNNIIANPALFTSVFQSGDDIAVHTWNHPYMTTLNNLQVVAQLGWCAQLIYNSTGGRVPKYFRPPYGDTDNRVSAIAREVFGMTTVIWNQDTGDWSLSLNGTTVQQVQSNFQRWLTGPKTPGLIVLEHELSDAAVQTFITAYPLIKSNGWNTASLAAVLGTGHTYQNTDNATSPVTSDNIVNAAYASMTNTPTSSSTVTGNSLGASQSNFNKNNAALSHNSIEERYRTLFGMTLFIVFYFL